MSTIAAPFATTAEALEIAQESVSQLIPAWFDIAFSIVPLILVGAMIAGLVSIVRRYRFMSGLESFGWTAFVIFAPAMGTLVWFLAGRARYSAHTTIQ